MSCRLSEPGVEPLHVVPSFIKIASMSNVRSCLETAAYIECIAKYRWDELERVLKSIQVSV